MVWDGGGVAEKVRVVVGDDHPLFREGVVRALTSSGEIDVVTEAGAQRGPLVGGLDALRMHPGAEQVGLEQADPEPAQPLDPLIECAARKIAFRLSSSGAPTSSPSSSDSIVARCSAVSSKNTW